MLKLSDAYLEAHSVTEPKIFYQFCRFSDFGLNKGLFQVPECLKGNPPEPKTEPRQDANEPIETKSLSFINNNLRMKISWPVKTSIQFRPLSKPGLKSVIFVSEEYASYE